MFKNLLAALVLATAMMASGSLVAATPTPSWTPTTSPTPTWTPTVTSTFTASRTFTISPTFTVSPTVTPTVTIAYSSVINAVGIYVVSTVPYGRVSGALVCPVDEYATINLYDGTGPADVTAANLRCSFVESTNTAGCTVQPINGIFSRGMVAQTSGSGVPLLSIIPGYSRIPTNH